MKKSVLRKALAVSLSATMLLGTGFTAVGQFAGTDVSVSAAETSQQKIYAITGTMTGWGMSSDIRMYEMQKGIFIGKTHVLEDGDYEFKVRVNGEWDENYGPYEPEFDRTCNSRRNISVKLYRCAAIYVMLDTTLTDSRHYPLSYAIVEDFDEEPEWIYKGGPLCFENFTYMPDTHSVTITRCVGNDGDSAYITLPKEIRGKKVTALSAYQDVQNGGIAVGAFKDYEGLKGITIPDTVTTIYDLVFADCPGLEYVYIPESVTNIEEYDGAFAGSYNVKIHGEKGSYAEQYANKHRIPFVADVAELVNESMLSAEEIVLGQTIMVNAKSSEDNCTYAVLYKKKSDTKWTVKQNYSTNDTTTIKPAKATDYDVCVKVKNSDGKIVKKFFEVKVNAKLKNTSTISATEIKKGNTITLHGSATGGMGGYTYAALYKKKSETKWTTV